MASKNKAGGNIVKSKAVSLSNLAESGVDLTPKFDGAGVLEQCPGSGEPRKSFPIHQYQSHGGGYLCS
ncbi:hypothetical protein SESBI_29835 [Sesbania bispinosa]|nr:hypothetical protein SESBI_29835 [Sesbania bispinosa]